MGMGLNAFANDIGAEEEGIWFPIDEMEFKVAKVGNEAWKKLYKRLERQTYNHSARKKEKRDADKDVKIMLECLARTSIVDWKGVSLDGKEIKFSEEKSVEILTDKRFRRLAEALLDIAMDEEQYAEAEIKKDEDSAKN